MEKQIETTEKKSCHFCQEGIVQVDYKDPSLLRKFISPYGRILGKRKMGLCAKHQRSLTRAVKRARYLSLLPFTL